MKHAIRISLIPVLMLMAACNHPQSAEATAPPQASHSAPAPSSKLSQLLRLQSIGTTKEFLERTIGPSTSETEADAQYTVEGCPVTLALNGKTVTSVDVTLAKGCHPDLAGILGQQAPMPVGDSLTFAQFEKAGGEAQYHSPCIEMCGNAFDPYVDAIISGSHANGFNDVIARATFVPDDAINASEQWAEQLKAAAGEDFVTDAKFNCDSSHNGIPRKLFAGVKVQDILFGTVAPDSSCQ